MHEIAAAPGRLTRGPDPLMVMYNYVFIGFLLFAAIAFAVAPLLVVALLAPRKRYLTKADTYECGVRTYGETWVRFRIQYYIYAMMFVIFDIEAVFLLPWAVSYAGLGIFALVEMAIFLILLAVGLGYAWAKGVLRWV
jgi:NADH-quinone oxidoreductase subunit A